MRPMTQTEYDRWLPEVMVGYAEDMIGSGVDPEIAHAKSARDFPTFLPDGLATDGQLLYTVVADGEAVGVLWLTERDDDMGKSLFILDVQIDEEQRGRGLGKAAMLLVEDEARRRGIERVTLNVFGGNDVARNLYRSLGYGETAVYMMKRV